MTGAITAASIGAAGSLAGAAGSKGKGGGGGNAGPPVALPFSSTTTPQIPDWLSDLMKSGILDSNALFKLQSELPLFDPMQLRGQQSLLNQLPGIRGNIRGMGRINARLGDVSGDLGRLATTFQNQLTPFMEEDLNSPINAAYRESGIAPLRREFLETILPRLGSDEALSGNIGSSKGTLEEIGAGERYLRQVGDVTARANQESLNRRLQAIGLLPSATGIHQARAGVLGQRANLLQQIIGARQIPGQIQMGIGNQRFAQPFQRQNDIIDNYLKRLGIGLPFIGSNTKGFQTQFPPQGGLATNPFATALGGALGAYGLYNQFNSPFKSSSSPPYGQNLIGGSAFLE